MKKLLLLILLLTTCYSLLFSQNLVPNPSFEEYMSCPDNYNDIYKATGWQGFDSDYYNACDTTMFGFGVPYNNLGFQKAASGNAYAGLNVKGDFGENYREFIGRQLSEALSIGKKYYVSFKINAPDLYECYSNKIGILFANQLYSDTTFPPIRNFSHVYTEAIIADTVNWYVITGSFIADSNYSHIIIANFFNDENTDTICNGTDPNPSSYYFIDDICVSPDSTACEMGTRIKETDKNLFSISPIPAKEELFLKTNTYLSSSYKMSIYNIVGQLISSGDVNQSISIDISEYRTGIYFIQFTSGKRTYTQKFIKQ